MSNNDKKIKASVVIATRDRAGSLAATLDSVIAQKINPKHKYEIIVIDSSSAENTKSLISDFQKKYPQIEIGYFRQEKAGPGKARNLGIKEAKGEIIFFTDDDCIVPSDWIKTLLDGYKRYPDVVGVGGWSGPENNQEKRNYLERYVDYFEEKIMRPKIAGREIKTNVFLANFAGNTTNMSYKKYVLEDAGGFDENLKFAGWADWELKKNIQNRGYHLLCLPYFVKHVENFNLRKFFKKFFNRGRWNYYMVLKYLNLSERPTFNLNFSNLAKNMFSYFLNNNKFLFGHFFYLTSMLLGKIYAKYFDHFKIEHPR